jgi:hypothetical protein
MRTSLLTGSKPCALEHGKMCDAYPKLQSCAQKIASTWSIEWLASSLLMGDATALLPDEVLLRVSALVPMISTVSSLTCKHVVCSQIAIEMSTCVNAR